MDSQFTVPVISGGVPRKGDIAPCAIYIAAYVCVIAGSVYRMWNARSRWVTLHQRPIAFSIERIVLFSLRLACINNTSLITSTAFLSSLDGMALASWFSLVHGLIDLLRYHAARTFKGTKDDRKTLFNRLALIHFWGLAALPMPIISSVRLSSTPHNHSLVNTVTILRYVPTAMMLALLLYIIYLTLKNSRTCARPEPQAATYLVTMASVLAIVPIYKLCTFFQRVPTLGSHSPTYLVVTFYIIQCIPELLVASAFVLLDLRALYGGRGKRGNDPGRPEDPDDDETQDGTAMNSTDSLRTSRSKNDAPRAEA